MYQLSSSWHKSFSVPNRLVGSYQKVGTKMHTSHWSDSAVTLCKPPEISTVCLFHFSLHSLSSVVRQTSTCSSRRRLSSHVDEIATLNYSPSLVIAAHPLLPSSSCSCEFSSLSSRIPAHVILTTIPGNNSAVSTLSPTIHPPYSRRPTSPRSKLCSHRGALVP